MATTSTRPRSSACWPRIRPWPWSPPGPVPDDVRGELACAYVVLVPGASATEEELVAFAGESLAAYKRPRVVRFVDDLPKTSTGKIMRRELIKLFPGD